MSVSGRYWYCPMTQKRIGRRVTIMDRVRRYMAQRRMAQVDVFPTCAYNPPIYPKNPRH